MRRAPPLVAWMFILLWAASAAAFLSSFDFVAKESENRVWAVWPRFAGFKKDPQQWTSAVNTYVADHFGFRSTFIRVHNWLKLRGFRTPPNDLVVLGKNGWLFWAGQSQLPLTRNVKPFLRENIDRLTTVYGRTQAWMDRRGITFMIVIPPDPATVYSEMLPDWLKPAPGPTRREVFISRVNAFMHYPVLDLAPALKEARSQHPTYHATDSHWNRWGAFVSLNLVMKQLRQRRPEIAWEPERYSFDPVPAQGLDLARSMGLSDLYSDFKFTKPEPLYVRTDERDARNFTTICATCQDKTILMVRDSFGKNMRPYISNTFRKAVYVWDNVIPFARINAEKADIVLFEFVERKLRGLPPYAVPEN